MTTHWSGRTADRISRMQPSVIREILKVTQRPEVISFAGGLPAPELFPTERVKEATVALMQSDDAARALQYHPTEGYIGLREWLVGRMQMRSVPCRVDNIMITSGSQQSLDLIGKVLITPGETVAVESPTFLGMMQAWDIYGARYDSIRTDDQGILPDDLERSFRRGAKALYVIPTFHNPTGVTTSAPRRQSIVALADRYGVPIVEDDPYGQLRYEGTPLAALQSFDGKNLGQPEDRFLERGNTLFLGSFSKELCPGFRLAWIVGPVEIIRLLVQAKQGVDLHSSTFAQMVVTRVVQDGFIDQHIGRMVDVYGQRRDLMLQLMESLFPPGLSWTKPKGGLFIWVKLPESIDARDLFTKCIEKNVAFVPGQPFFPDGSGKNTLRLNFSNATPEAMTNGIERMAAVFREHL